MALLFQTALWKRGVNELISYLFRRFRRSDNGAALVELAIITPVLLLLMMGIIEFGWIFNGYITLIGAAREGARVAAVDGDYQQAITDHVNSLPRLTVNSPAKSGGEDQFDDITVTVSGAIARLTGQWLPLDDPFPLPPVTATMRRQYREE